MKFEEVQQYCDEIYNSMQKRTTMFKAMEDMFLMNGYLGSVEQMDWIKKTLSPDPRNKLIGAMRLLTAADPTFRAPREENDQSMYDRLSDIERAATAMWKQSGRARMRPVHYDLVQTALLYGEAHLVLKDTADLVELAKTPGEKRRAEEIARRTPIIYDVLNPKFGFPILDQFGMRAFYTRQDWRVVDIIARWGEIRELEGKTPTDKIQYNEYWDSDRHVVWLQGVAKPIVDDSHDWPIIPVVGQIVEGNPMFTEDNQQSRQPFLYSMWKSDLWNRQNLSLTLMYSLAFAYGANPQLVYKTNEPNKNMEVDYGTPGGLIKVENNEDVHQLAKQTVDPSIAQGLQTAKELTEEMTLYGATLGEPLGSNAPYSMVALLSQAGRLPLVPYQRMCSWIISEATRAAFAKLRQKGGSYPMLGEKGVFNFDASELDETTFEIEAILDIGLPQDDRQMVTVAMQATQGDRPLVSMEYAREKYLKIGQSDAMDEAIWAEQMAYAKMRMELQKLELQLQMQAQQMQQMMAQQMQQPPQGGPMIPGQMPEGTAPMGQMPQQQPQQPPRGPAGIPPEVAAAMAAQGGASGIPMTPGAAPSPAGAGEGLPMEGPMEMQGGM